MTAKALLVALVAAVVGWFMRPPEQDATTRIPKLINALSHKSAHVRWHAALDLGKIGELAAPAVPALIAALSDENAGVRQRAAEALQKINDPRGLQAIEDAKRERDVYRSEHTDNRSDQPPSRHLQ